MERPLRGRHPHLPLRRARGARPLDPGTEWTLEAVALHARERHVIEVSAATDGALEVEAALGWIREKRIRVLNVAGPSEGISSGAGAWAHWFLSRLFVACREG